MGESKQHKMLKNETKEHFQNKGYNLISFDREIVDGYRPDIILENEEEVLFVEVVATSDHDLEKEYTYNGKPVRYVKYYTLDSWLRGKVTNRPVFKRKNTEEIVKRIMQALNSNFKTVDAISKEIECVWRTTYDYLNLIFYIQSCPKIIKMKAGKRIYFMGTSWGDVDKEGGKVK